MMERISNIQDAQRFLASVHGFTDGFIRELTLRSRDYFEVKEEASDSGDVSHVCTGEFDAIIVFECHPTIAGPPQPRTVRAMFHDVQDICVDLRGFEAAEWPLENVTISEAEDQRFRLNCARWRITADREWRRQELQLLSFTMLDVDEITESAGDTSDPRTETE